MDHSLVIRGGTIVDGTGGTPFVGDVAVREGHIVSVGAVDGDGDLEIDATGRAVTPGFVDIHTHYDGHATWAQHLDPSSEHGVTTVVTGNCGVGFAPCHPQDHARLIELMEGVEDIPEVVMSAGLAWDWESFPDYLDRLAVRHFDVDVAAQVPHAPLRLFVMGERAVNREPATPEDVATMRALTTEAVVAGALGFSTSRSLNHRASDGTVTPSYSAGVEELVGIARGLRDPNLGVLQIISDFDDVDAEFAIIRQMVEASGRPLTASLVQFHHVADRWRRVLDHIESARAEGVDIKAQVSGRPIGMILGFSVGRNPFMGTDGYREIARLPDPARHLELRRPERRQRILAEFPGRLRGPAAASITNFAEMYELAGADDYEPSPEQSMQARATAAATDPAAFTYDLLVGGEAVLYVPAANFADNSISAIESMLASSATVLGLGDGGAHCGVICDASLPTYMLERWSDAGGGPMPVETVVKALTWQTASAVGLHDRGMVTVGRRADLNVIDLKNLHLHRPEMFRDLPNGGGRLGQPASGYDATIVAGEVTHRHGSSTGALPGRLVRGAKQNRRLTPHRPERAGE